MRQLHHTKLLPKYLKKKKKALKCFHVTSPWHRLVYECKQFIHTHTIVLDFRHFTIMQEALTDPGVCKSDLYMITMIFSLFLAHNCA